MPAIQIFRPLQVGFNNQVLEQNRKFYFIASAILGVNLQTSEELLDVNYLKDAFEGMEENSLPDMGMPKPNGEFLVSGNFFAPDNQAVTGGEIKIRLDEIEKKLFIFGPRKWKAGFPSKPEEIRSMPLDYTKAFGGQGFKKNPDGIGFNDGLLPCIEDPRHLVASKGDKPDPVGFSYLYPMLPQRMKYQGTYDSDYKNKYFPGYPEDHDWKYFLCAPSNQWIKDFYKGDESFSINNMHPEIPIIEGRLPGLYTRCFINQGKEGEAVFGELPLNLDTIWFFPEKLLGLLIFRGVIEVEDDEAENISHVLCAYEDKSQEPRSLEYYKAAFEKRENSDDALLNNLNTKDLIPEGHKCAMELLMEMGLSELDGEESAFSKNMDAKAKATQKISDEKIEEVIQQAENNMENVDTPDDGRIDIRKMMKEPPDVKPDPDIEAMSQKLEAILPGITADTPQKLDMKRFSFDKIDEIMEAVDELSSKKQKEAQDLTKKEIGKVKEQVKEQIETIDKQIEEAKKVAGSKGSGQVKLLEDSKKQINERLKALDDIDFNGTSKAKAPLPRIDIEKIRTQTEKINPQIMEAMQHVQSMKAMGIEDEKTKDIEKQIQEMFETSTKQVEEGLQEVEKGFKEGYLMGAHFMDEGLSPHKDSLEDVKARFLETVSLGEDLSGKDWACIDLEGVNLDGIDLSGAFLEQVNFKGTSLKNANFSEAILARADLEDADLTGANFEKANVGAVHALRTNFTDANLNSAKLSKGDFTQANFTNANLEGIESLEVVIEGANFSKAYMSKVNFIETKISKAKFINADMNTSAFIKCSIEDSDFSESLMNKCAFVETQLKNVSFEKADLSNACFVATEPEKYSMENLKFKGACLAQANFQNMDMQKSDLSYSNIENAFFGSTDLSESDLSYAQAKNAQFRKAKLTRAKLYKINLDQGSLAKANLVGASFIGANLHAVDFLRSTITDTDFRGSNLDATLIEHWRP
ncbi:MAG: DUF2169 domain-containing protein [Deltaproteobacteria bacterium]|uniref:DUF2169 domain-containing protein n=1 Tax=Desulfobacula sp. TaxID=2593537 RepID=UPI00199BA8DF|nr:DUF2169 domain-containing protein [Candidatus Desulfobacula maris]MBL6993055.1 DUF2169 domain-containing protein [Desulfobacula sp.]